MRFAFLFFAVAMVMVAGCMGDVPETEGDSSFANHDADADAPVVSVEQIDVVSEPFEDGARYVVRVTGTVDRSAIVFVSPAQHDAVNYERLEFNGSFDVEMTLWSADPGPLKIHTNAMTYEDGESTAHAAVESTVNLPARATVSIDYGDTSDKEPVNDTVWVDVVNYAAQSHYDERGVKHPEFVNIHDALAEWEEQHDHVIEYGYNEGVQSFSVSRIDGEGNAIDAEDDAVGSRDPPYWCYTINGESDGVQGITTQRFTPGDVIHWELGSCGNLGLMA